MIDFSHIKLDISKAIKYGFKYKDSSYFLDEMILENEFILHLNLNFDGLLSYQVIEKESGEEYLLYKVASAQGEFVNNLRFIIESRIEQVIEQCQGERGFSSPMTKMICEYIKRKYNEDLLYLWKNDFDDAVFRHLENGVWYGVIMRISKRKLGLDSDELIEVLDLKNKPAIIQKIIDNKCFFPAYHMNKKHWVTFILDNRTSLETIFKLIDESYQLTIDKKKGVFKQ